MGLLLLNFYVINKSFNKQGLSPWQPKEAPPAQIANGEESHPYLSLELEFFKWKKPYLKESRSTKDEIVSLIEKVRVWKEGCTILAQIGKLPTLEFAFEPDGRITVVDVDWADQYKLGNPRVEFERRESKNNLAGKEDKERESKLRRIFAISGMSESGKSSVGRNFDAHGIKRLKIVDVLRTVMEKEEAGGDFSKWSEKTEAKRPKWLYQRFVEELLALVKKEDLKYCSIESLYGPGLATYLKKSLGERFVLIYVHVPQSIRIKRQMDRRNLKTVEEAKRYLLPRDKAKKEKGVPRLRKMADIVIDNSGTIEELRQQIDRIIGNYCPVLNEN